MGFNMNYLSLNTYLRNTYGEKLYRLSLQGGMTCPNRDSTLGTGGCIFCSAGGSGEFAASATLSITEQIESAKQRVADKFKGSGYIAYFQSYTNTYAPVEYLEQIFTEAITHPDIRILAIATRPDCLGPEVLDLLDRLQRIKPVWIELGLQTAREETATYIRRGYPLQVFEEAVANLRRCGIDVIVHLILGLPGETRDDMFASVDYIGGLDIQGVKLQLLHVLQGTDLEKEYANGNVELLDMEEYISIVGECVEHLPEHVVIHRLTGDGDKRLLVAPKWSADKKRVMNAMQRYFREQDIVQGCKKIAMQQK